MMERFERKGTFEIKIEALGLKVNCLGHTDMHSLSFIIKI